MTPEFFQITEGIGGKAPLPLHVTFWVLPAVFLPEYFCASFYKSHFAQMDLVYQVIQITWCLCCYPTTPHSFCLGAVEGPYLRRFPINL